MNIYRTSPKQNQARVAREAAEWLQLMRAEPGARERAAFAAWVADSPAHLRELLLAQMVERELRDGGALKGFDLDAVLAEAKATDNVVSLPTMPAPAATMPSSRLRRSHRRGPGWALAAGVAACAILGIGWKLMRLDAPVLLYASALGEQRTIALDDGSVVLLAPASSMAVRYSAGVRDIELREGEATFEVAHDTSRPFRVHAGNDTVQAVGTRFTVNRLPSGTLVAVTEGRVKVTADSNWLAPFWQGDGAPVQATGNAKVESLKRPAALVAGEQARIPQGRQALLRTPLPPPSGPAGGRPRLSFRNDPLGDIVAEFNRYNRQPIVVEDEDIRRQRYSGVFDADDADAFLQFLECCTRLRVTREGGRDLVTGPRQ